MLFAGYVGITNRVGARAAFTRIIRASALPLCATACCTSSSSFQRTHDISLKGASPENAGDFIDDQRAHMTALKPGYTNR